LNTKRISLDLNLSENYTNFAMYYEKIFENLNNKQVQYVVVGGVACVLHGVVRLTADLDIMICLEENNITKFVTIMNELGYKPKVPVKAEDFISAEKRKKWIKEKNMKVLSFFHPDNPVNLIDVFIEEFIDFKTIISDAVKMKSGKTTIPVASIKNLIKLKEISGRPQDIADIRALKEIEKNG